MWRFCIAEKLKQRTPNRAPYQKVDIPRARARGIDLNHGYAVDSIQTFSKYNIERAERAPKSAPYQTRHYHARRAREKHPFYIHILQYKHSTIYFKSVIERYREPFFTCMHILKAFQIYYVLI